MVQLTFLGSCQEIGRSGFLVTGHDESILVDYGVKFQNPVGLPVPISTDDLQGVILTHAHLDHSGAVPQVLSDSDVVSLFCTPATRDLTALLLHDMFKVTTSPLPYAHHDIRRVFDQCQPTAYEDTLPLGREFEMTLFNAGHIPGSAMVSLSIDGRRILFTGDFNALPSRLHAGVRLNLPRHDVVVTESTYARRVNPPREEIERALVASIIDTMDRGGVALIPAFAVGRSQEIMCILEQYGITRDYPVYVDGLARDVNEIVMQHPNYIACPREFERAVRHTRLIHDSRDRHRVIHKGGVIISPAGMLKGGASKMLFENLYDDPSNTIILVSFQIPGTPGAELLSTRQVTLNRRVLRVRAEVRYHHLSSHSDTNGLMELLMRVPGDPEFYVVHGEPESCDALAQALTDSGHQAYVPEMGDSFEV